MKTYGISLFFLLLFGLSPVAGQEPPASREPEPARLGDILDKPSSFAEKRIVLEGNFAKRNCNYCFMYKEGVDSVKIEPKGFHSPKLKPGTPVRIKGRVRVKKQEVVVEAEAVDPR